MVSGPLVLKSRAIRNFAVPARRSLIMVSGHVGTGSISVGSDDLFFSLSRVSPNLALFDSEAPDGSGRGKTPPSDLPSRVEAARDASVARRTNGPLPDANRRNSSQTFSSSDLDFPELTSARLFLSVSLPGRSPSACSQPEAVVSPQHGLSTHSGRVELVQLWPLSPAAPSFDQHPVMKVVKAVSSRDRGR